MTIKDVAAKAGVSISTVSKVLNDKSLVSSDTAKRVFLAAKELNYHPNARARSLASKSTRSVVFIADFPTDAAFINPHIFEIIRGLEHALSQRDLSLVIRQSDVKSVMALVEKYANEKSFDAMIIHASVLSKRLANLIIKLDIRYIVIGQPNFDSPLCWVDSNNSLSGEIAARHLSDKGYLPSIFIAGRSDDMISNHRLLGVNKEMMRICLDMEKQNVIYTESTIYSGRGAAKKVLKMKNRPRSAICANNVIAFGFIEELQSQNISIPDDIAVISFDVYPFSRYSNPQITVVDIDMFALGCDAGNLILDIISNPALQVQSFSTKPILIQGKSS